MGLGDARQRSDIFAIGGHRKQDLIDPVFSSALPFCRLQNRGKAVEIRLDPIQPPVAFTGHRLRTANTIP
jgi:hypothetical protein